MREPIRIEDHKGYRYRPLAPELEEALPGWLAAGCVEGGEDLKWGAVFRWRDLVVKFGGPSRRLRDRFRPSASIRSADMVARLPSVSMPEPHLALERRGIGGLESHLLVCEFIDGRFLHEVFHEDAQALEAYARFLAEMHGRGIYHGDLHTLNTLWDGERWVVIDMKGFRNRLHNVLRKRMILNHWGLIFSNLTGYCEAQESELRGLYERYVELCPVRFDSEAIWREALQISVRRSSLWIPGTKAPGPGGPSTPD